MSCDGCEYDCDVNRLCFVHFNSTFLTFFRDFLGRGFFIRDFRFRDFCFHIFFRDVYFLDLGTPDFFFRFRTQPIDNTVVSSTKRLMVNNVNRIEVFVYKCLRRIIRVQSPGTISNSTLWEITHTDKIESVIRR